MKEILHSKPWLTEEDRQALEETLASGMVGQGHKTRAFEQALGRWVGAGEGAAAVGSGSAALLLALEALGVGPGDEVVVPTYVCRAVLQAVLASGATPVCCDAGPHWVVTRESVAPRLGRRTRALILPHLYGVFVDVGSIRDFGIPIIEDCAQAVDRQGGRELQGDIGVFSFHATKCLTTGEGGMAVSADAGLAERLRQLRDGSREAASARVFSPLSDLAAALGLSQLSRYERALARRAELARRYLEQLSPIVPAGVPDLAAGRTMWFRFPLMIQGGLQACGEAFARRGIHVRQGVDELLHRLLGLPDRDYPMAVRLFSETVSLPIYPALEDPEHTRCVQAAAEIFAGGGCHR